MSSPPRLPALTDPTSASSACVNPSRTARTPSPTSSPSSEAHVHRRQAHRRRSYVAEVADATMAGAGIHGHALALTHIAHPLEKSAR
ncbi:type II 3-dehydroquinate dehydratase [Streptomyces sp. NPDC060198]|uniref:type II 3-dehydroquinate dehydratase n=1 Tax=Streptomyces sp. NPDC060198 TaxID=3347070 RepID=UPI00364A4CA4